MVETRGSATAHTADGHIGLPMAVDRGIRPAHRPQPRKATGLDWSAISPPCSLCGNGSSELRDGLCPPCRGVAATPKDKKEKAGVRTQYEPIEHDEVERRYERPPVAPTPETPPSVGEPEPPGPRAADEPTPDPSDPSTWAWSVPKDVDHVAQVLVRAAASEDPVARLLRLNILSAAESLYLYLEHQRYATPTTTCNACKVADRYGVPPRHPVRPVEDVPLPEPSRCFTTPGTHAADCELAPVAPTTDGEWAKSALDEARQTLVQTETDPPTFQVFVPSEAVDARGRRIGNRGKADADKRALLDQLGATPAQVKEWAVETGLIPFARTGRVPGALVDAYAAAHPGGADGS